MGVKIPRIADDSARMTLTTTLHRHALRVVAVLALTGYAAIMAPLLRQDLQLATLGDTLDLKRREVDVQLEQNDRDFQIAKKRHSDDASLLADEHRILSVQGQQITREIERLQVRRSLWSSIYWSVFALAHLFVLPLALWSLAAAASVQEPAAGRRRTAATPRKRTPRSTKNPPPKLVPQEDHHAR